MLLNIAVVGRLSDPISDIHVGSITFFVNYLYFQDLSEKLAEQELQFRRLSQEQVDNFTLDINTAYARLRGIEQAVQSKHVEPLTADFIQPYFLE